MKNMDIYNAVQTVPQSALKAIQAGRLKGKSDINPMWRIKILTETFGACGIGWKYTITDKRLECGASGEIGAFVDILLYYKHDGEWSEGIPGTGGSMFVASEKNGLYTSDECFKMALTDAISVACKALGVGASVYWAAGSQTKYDKETPAEEKKVPQARKMTYEEALEFIPSREDKPLKAIWKDEGLGKIKEIYGQADGETREAIDIVSSAIRAKKNAAEGK